MWSKEESGMNREIKFRGKRLDNKEWVYGFYIHYQGWHYIVTPEYFNEGCSDCGSPFAVWHLVDIETVGQYTGLKDKNGKEIYEGDIFHLGDINIKYIVEWIDTGFMGRQNGNTSSVGLEYWQDKIEVVGNIYENKELLEVE
jgi:hypothetical protein